MVESSNKKVNFIKCQSIELIEKLLSAIDQNEHAIFWKYEAQTFEGQLFKIRVLEEKIFLTLKKSLNQIELLNQSISLYIKLNSDEFLFKSIVKNQNSNTFEIEFQLEDQCYRIEKRVTDRISIVNNEKIFLIGTYKKKSLSNVLSLPTKNKDLNHLFKAVEEVNLKKKNSLNVGSILNEDESYYEYELDDFSASGLSFFVNGHECNLFENLLQLSKSRFYIQFKNNFYEIVDLKVVHKINAVNPKFNFVKLEKLGIGFTYNVEIERCIIEFNTNKNWVSVYQKQFEEFLNDE